MTNQVSPTSEAEEVRRFMKANGFLLVDDDPVCWYEQKVTPRRRLGFTDDQATFFYRIAKQAEIQGRIEEWEHIDGDDTHYWDYREVGPVTQKVFLSPIQRNDELEALLSKYKGKD